MTEQILQQFVPLIRAMASQLAQRLPACLDAQDLMSAGTMGLMNALRKRDPARAESFRSYAWCRIRGAMIEEIRAMSFVDRQAYERGERARMCDVADVVLTNTHSSDPLSALIKEEEQDAIAAAVHCLPGKARHVLALYYYQDLTMKDIGRVLHITGSRVCQIHAHALAQLKSTLERIRPEHPLP